jgi:hypothetical protein
MNLISILIGLFALFWGLLAFTPSAGCTGS